MSVSRKINFITLTLITIIYIAARFWGLTDSCLWFDEIFSVHAAQHPWNELFSFVARDLIHPPLFYVRLKLWMDVVGDSVFWLRLLPVIISCLAIVPFILLCRELKLKTWVTALALFFLAVNGSLIKYAQEVRMYSLLMCLSLFSMWLFARYLCRGKGLVWVVIVNVLLVYSHHFGWFVVAAEVVAVVVLQRAKWRQVAVMFGVVLASFLPWAIAVWYAASAGADLGQNIGWMSRPGIREVGTFIFDLIEPFYYQASSVDPASVYRVSVPILVVLLIAVAVYFANWNQRTEDEKRSIYFLSIFAGLPIAVAFFVSWLLPYSVWGTRHLIVVFAPCAILAATAIVSIPKRAISTAAVTLILLFTGLAFVHVLRSPAQTYSWCNWAPLGLHVTRTFNPERIYVFEEAVAYHLWFALHQHGDSRFMVWRIRNMPGVTEDPAYFVPRGFYEINTVDLNDVRKPRFWIAYRGVGIDETAQPLKAFIDAGYRVIDQVVLPASREDTILLLLEEWESSPFYGGE